MSIKLGWDLNNTLKETWFDSNSEVLEIAFIIRRILESTLTPSFIAKSPFNNFTSESVSSNAFLIYLLPFKMVIHIICKNVFTSKLLLFKLLLAMFWFAYVVIWVEMWIEEMMSFITVRCSAVHLRGTRFSYLVTFQ